MASEIVTVGENVSDLGEGGLVTDLDCGVEKLSVSMQSCEPFCIVEVDSSESLVVASDRTLDNISITECAGERKEEKDTVGSEDFASDSKDHDAMFLSVRMTNGVSNGPLLNTDTERPLRKCKKKSNKKVFPDIEFLELVRRRRSCSNKPRVSDWGSLETIGHVFKEVEDANLDQNEQKKSRKSRGRKGEATRKNSQRRRNSLGSKKEIPASTSHIRLKVRFGAGFPSDITPGVVDDHDRFYGTQIKFSEYNEDIEKRSKEGIPSTLDGHDAQTQVVLLEEAVGSRCLDPGTSPDSEVINLNAESQTDEKVAEVDILNKRCCVSGDISSLNLPKTFSRKGKKKNNPHQDVKGIKNDKPSSPEIIDNTGVAYQHGHLERKTDNAFSTKASMSVTTGSPSLNISSAGVYHMETAMQQYGVPSSGVQLKTFEVENGVGGGLCFPKGFQHERPEECITSAKPRDHENTGNLGSPWRRLEFSEVKSLEGNSHVQKGDQSDLKAKEISDCVQAICKNEYYSVTGTYSYMT